MYKLFLSTFGAGPGPDELSIQIYLKYKYTCENEGFCILCIDDFKILKIFNKRRVSEKSHVFNFVLRIL